MASLKLAELTKSFGDVDVIKPTSIDIKDGEFVVFVGPSGCGKSTTLRMISGLESPTSGQILMDDSRIDELLPADREIAMVFQSYALYPHKTVRGNLEFALKHAKVDRKIIDSKVDEVAQTLDLTDYMDRYPKALSGGQRQRVAIGRAIVREPKVFLFDEPLSNLDAALRVKMRVELQKLHQRLGTTMIYVTHDQTEAMTLADRIVVFNKGRVEQVGTPLELYERPANRFVAGFIGSPAMNFIEVEVHERQIRCAGAEIPLNQDIPDGRFTLGVRPEQISVSESGPIRGEVQVFEHLGNEAMAYIACGDSTIVARLDRQVQLRAGQSVGLSFSESDIHFFDQQTQQTVFS